MRNVLKEHSKGTAHSRYSTNGGLFIMRFLSVVQKQYPPTPTPGRLIQATPVLPRIPLDNKPHQGEAWG